jgi:DNA primase
MKKEGMDFNEALKILADKAGVSLVRKKKSDEGKLSERLYLLNEEAAKFYHDILLKDPVAVPAREYVNGRGLNQISIDKFQLGFSKAEGLKRHLLDKGFSEKELLTVGLVGEKEGRTYDYFRNRLMFPIKDIKGRVLGFGARALDESLPKYLNSPQTAVFDKSGILYGIDRAKGAIRERGVAVIVEGYMDVITAHQHDVANVVASMGTALTEKQVRILRGLAKSLVFALDPDAAGSAATMRGIDVARRSLNREGLEMPTLLGATSRLKADIRIIPLPEGKDPDALIRENPQEWQRLVDQALTLMDYIIEVVTSRIDVAKPEGRSEAIEQLLPLIAELEDETQREFYLGKLAKLLHVNERTLLGQVASLIRTKTERSSKVRAKPASAIRSGDALEEYCLAMLLQRPELRDRADNLLPEHFESSENREIFSAWINVLNVDELRQAVSIDLEEHLEILLGKVLPPADDLIWEKALVDCIGRLEERRLRLQEQFLTFENVPQVSAGDLDSTRLAIVQQSTVEVDAQLTKKMRERTG